MKCRNAIIFSNLLEVTDSILFLLPLPNTIQRPINRGERLKLKYFTVMRHKTNICQRTGLRSRELCKHGHSKYRVNVPEIVMHLQIWWRRNSLVHGSNNIGTGKIKAVRFFEGQFIQIFRVYSFLFSALGQFQKSLWMYCSHRFKIFLRYPFKNVYFCRISLFAHM